MNPLMELKKAKAEREGNGGKPSIRIKEKNKGKFTAKAKKAGESVPEFAQEQKDNPQASPATRKQAQFAANAAQWRK